MPPFRPILLLDTDDTGAGSGGAPPADPPAGLRNLVERQGSLDATAVLLYNENYQLRERLRTASAAVPPHGAVVLTAEQASAWQAYQQLGAPDALQAALTERDTARTELTTLRRDMTLRDVAAAAGMTYEVLRDRDAAAGGLTYTITERDGQRHVTVADASNPSPVPLDDYAQQHWAMYLPVLRPSGGTAPTGTGYLRQAPAGAGAAGDPVNAFIVTSNERRTKAANPLKKS